MNFKSASRRKDRLIRDRRKDAYVDQIILKDPAVCSKCNAVYTNGRWTWKTTEQVTTKTTCPACRRISDNYPAGNIEIKGNFFHLHSVDILNLVNNIERLEKTERPLERIISITESKVKTIITTTGIHIARRIGEALSRSYQGNFNFQYADGDKSIRVFWEREN
ncbi:MAG: ATPase [Ignavibacteria bacterium RIFOXYB2_FULL_35_12]|nr:MAG: ATPase [Ignavibacteria bacterium GWA2_36_19]OGU53891.1 MAG: ATPase [Ignavibacteria bacterium GWC2_35_8]OGU55951.1 MAG: ATPase [Ignavibacteria bacterium GWF2_35_20]OGU83187.1 MAG: ATPase [Ignavibacteria bacterium RIFOXYA2_FULL_35_9]OGU85669.1 MAG: ATPase [Ignavibacteria bacterium RIFOXYA12_FULL_35_25]OGU91324.1 MAG: ATPase [Ignavibacteria bacterium RIFOXYC12_FULL_35_11]OGU93596.1 MAG: ATPase [Ignavibacteria bacterium RIFOXYB12_FULL_35_14]OGV01815.1 MAG: ATPase [Ignavibacteria bacteriu